MKIKEKTFEIAMIICSIILLISGYELDNPFGNRQVILLLLTGTYLVISSYKLWGNNSLMKVLCQSILLILLVIIDLNSKYVINYFYHIIYYIEMIYCVSNIANRSGKVLALLLSISAGVKFVSLVIIEPSIGNITLTGFIVLINILILVIIILAKSYREEGQNAKVLYRELLETYKQLKNYASEVKSLTVYEERTKIARDLHDTLGHDMTGLIMQMEIASSSMLKKGQQAAGEKMLEESKTSAREALKKVREIVNTLKDDEVKWSKQAIKDLIRSYAEKTQINIESEIEDGLMLSPEVGIVVYRVVQEALTNSVRHGSATIINVSIKALRDNTEVQIKDNGVGCDEIIYGNGLKGMENRVKAIKGQITFSGEGGFSVMCKLKNIFDK